MADERMTAAAVTQAEPIHFRSTTGRRDYDAPTACGKTTQPKPMVSEWRYVRCPACLALRPFPVLGVDGRTHRGHPFPRSVPWRLLAPHEAQALKNHDQTLERLAERGGLSPSEMRLIVEGRRWRGDNLMGPADEYNWICDWLSFNDAAPATHQETAPRKDREP